MTSMTMTPAEQLAEAILNAADMKLADFRPDYRERILAAAEPYARAVEALRAPQRHVIRHACKWDEAENGSHHHPIWAEVAEALAAIPEPSK